jgi:hypothetical protein
VIEERLICVEQIDEVVVKRRSEPTQRTVRAYSSTKQSPGALAQLGQVQPGADGSRIEMLMAQNAFGAQTVLVNGQDVAEPTSVLTRILKFRIYT